jgi:hypothetical protein
MPETAYNLADGLFVYCEAFKGIKERLVHVCFTSLLPSHALSGSEGSGFAVRAALALTRQSACLLFVDGCSQLAHGSLHPTHEKRLLSVSQRL